MITQQVIRKIHVYSGLCLFLPLFIFSVSGFMLNHRWQPWENFEKRIEIAKEVQIIIPETGSGLDKAKTILESLRLSSEINTLINEPEKDHLLIRAHRPGQFLELNASLSSGKGNLKLTNLDAWSLFNNVHTFTGLHSNIAEKKNWKWTKVWSFIMDVTAFAMLVLLISGIYMWTQLKNEKRSGFLVLELSSVIFIIIIWALSRF